MKSEKQVVYDNLLAVHRLMQNALYHSKNPYMEGAKITVTAVELERVNDALNYIKNTRDKENITGVSLQQEGKTS